MDIERMVKLAKELAVLSVEAAVLELTIVSSALEQVISDVLYAIRQARAVAAIRETEGE